MVEFFFDMPARNAAAQQPGQQPLRLLLLAARHARTRTAQPLRRIKGVVGDDPQVRRIAAMPFAFRPVAPNPLFRVRFAYTIGPIPDQPTAVKPHCKMPVLRCAWPLMVEARQ